MVGSERSNAWKMLVFLHSIINFAYHCIPGSIHTFKKLIVWDCRVLAMVLHNSIELEPGPSNGMSGVVKNVKYNNIPHRLNYFTLGGYGKGTTNNTSCTPIFSLGVYRQALSRACLVNSNYNITHNLTTSVSILLLPAEGEDIMLSWPCLLPSVFYCKNLQLL